MPVTVTLVPPATAPLVTERPVTVGACCVEACTNGEIVVPSSATRLPVMSAPANGVAPPGVVSSSSRSTM